MIKSVTITNYLGESVKITLAEDDPEHGMIISSITGLGPPKANVSMTDLATMDGSLFNSARVEKGTLRFICSLLLPQPLKMRGITPINTFLSRKI